jgi:hypothetical protein
MVYSALHIHTMQIPPKEGVQTTSIEKLLGQLYGKNVRNQIDGESVRLLLITNKNSISDVIKAKKYEAKLGMFIPYAIEARTRPDNNGNVVEVIAVFDELNRVRERLLCTADLYRPEEYVARVKEEGGWIILPHPYFKRNGAASIKREEFVEKLCRKGLVDAIEWNLAMDSILTWGKNDKANNLRNRINRKYGSKIPLVYGNDSYFGETGVLMKIESDDPRESLYKLFEDKFSPRRINPPMPKPYYLLKHLDSVVRHEPESLPHLLF